MEAAFCHCIISNKDGFSRLLAVVAPNLATPPSTLVFNQMTSKGSRPAGQMFGPALHGIAMAVADCVAAGTSPLANADDTFIGVGEFIHCWAEDDPKIQDDN